MFRVVIDAPEEFLKSVFIVFLFYIMSIRVLGDFFYLSVIVCCGKSRLLAPVILSHSTN